MEDHPVFLEGIVSLLENHYPNTEIIQAGSVQEAQESLRTNLPELVVFDLAIPVSRQDEQQAQPETGIKLLKEIMGLYPNLNLAVQSTYTKALIRLCPDIDDHQGGFTVIEKNRSSQDALELIDIALRGYTNTKEIRKLQSGLEVKPEWLEVLRLAFSEGLQDKAIAEQMQVQPGTVRHYWRKLYDVLSIDPEMEREAKRNLRTLAEMRAREKGLID